MDLETRYKIIPTLLQTYNATCFQTCQVTILLMVTTTCLITQRIEMSMMTMICTGTHNRTTKEVEVCNTEVNNQKVKVKNRSCKTKPCSCTVTDDTRQNFPSKVSNGIAGRVYERHNLSDHHNKYIKATETQL